MIALGGATAPALADNHGAKSRAAAHASSSHGAPGGALAGPGGPGAVAPLSTAVTAKQASDAVAQDAIAVSLAAAREVAARQAEQQATRQAAAAASAAAAKHKAAVAAEAAKARATASAPAASRSAKRATLTATPAASSSSAAAPAPSGTKVDRLIAFLKAQIGKPYAYGATGPDAYDCSGLTQAAFSKVGVSLPRTSQEQSTAGTPVSLNSLRPGDLVFWGGEGSAYHVGVYVGGGQYLDAANPSSPVGIKPLTYSEPDWAVRVL